MPDEKLCDLNSVHVRCLDIPPHTADSCQQKSEALTTKHLTRKKFYFTFYFFTLHCSLATAINR